MRRPSASLAGPLALAGLFLFPGAAQAHSPIKGMGDFVNGVLHPLTTPTHVLVIIGLGLMAGRRPLQELKPALWVFLPLSALALALTTLGWNRELPPALLVGLAMVAGAFLALEKIPPVPVSGVLFGAAALFLGLDSAVESADASRAFKTLTGNWLGLTAFIFDLAIYVYLAGDAKWLKIALRIAGAWIIAIGLMVLAFALRK